MKHQRISRFLCMLLSVLLLVTLLAPCALAADTDTEFVSDLQEGNAENKTEPPDTTDENTEDDTKTPTPSLPNSDTESDADSKEASKDDLLPAPADPASPSTPSEIDEVNDSQTQSFKSKGDNVTEVQTSKIATTAPPIVTSPAPEQVSSPLTIEKTEASLESDGTSDISSIASTSDEDGASARASDITGSLVYSGYLYRPSSNKDYIHSTPFSSSHNFNMMQLHTVNVDSTQYPAYCIDPGKPSTAGNYTGSSAGSDGDWSLDMSFTLSKNQQTAIGLILLYGYPNSLNSSTYATKTGYSAATQLLIWEIIIGTRSAVHPYDCTDYGLRDSFTGNCQTGAGVTVSNVRSAYDTIEASLKSHQIIPSFTARYSSSAPTHTLSSNRILSLTDTNNILSKYTFTNGNGLTFTANGNNLSIQADSTFTGPVSIAPVKYVPSLERASFLVWHNGKNQTLLSLANQVSNDPVPTYFKVKAPSGAVTVQKATNTGANLDGWVFGVYSDAACTKQLTTMTTNASGVATAENLNPGTVYIKELTSKDGWVSDSSVKSVTVSVGTTVSAGTFTNYQLGKVQITKNTNTGANRDNWQFGIYSDAACTKQLTTVTTGSDGKATSGYLYPGTVYVKELTSREGWALDTSVKSATVSAGKTVSVEAFNNTQMGKVQISKITNTGANLDGWEFGIYSDSDCRTLLTTMVTNSSGIATSAYLRPATVYIKELTTKEGWAIDTSVKSITISPGTTVTVSEAFVNNHLGDIKIIKNTNTGANRGGWVVNLYDANKTHISTVKIPDTGELTIPNLLPGTYYLEELSNGSPYWVCDTSMKTITVTAGSTTSQSLNNTHRGQVILSKQTNTGANLDGWTFGFYADSDCTDLKGTITTDSTGSGSLYLEPGTYYAKEINFNGRTDEYWTFDETVKEIVITEGQDTEITFTNIHNGKILIEKKLATDGSVADWEYKITRLSDNEDMGTFKSGTDGTVLTGQLLPGEYKVEEIFPENSLFFCKTENPVTVTVKEGETITASFINALRPGRIEIEKVNQMGTHLSDAKFLLEWSEDGVNWTPVAYSDKEDVVKGYCSTVNLENGCLTTDSSGIIAFENLYPSVQYRVTELEAPNGYLILTDHAFVGELPIENLEVKLDVVNCPGFTLPATGGSGNVFPVAFGTALATLALMSLFAITFFTVKSVCPRKKSDKNNKI